MNQKVLISCQNVGYAETSAAEFPAETMWDIRKLSLDLHAGERVCFHFQTEEQKNVLWRLFERKLKPKSGSLRISANIHVHSDQSLLDGLDMRSSMLQNLQSRLFDNRPWYGGKRKMMDTLMYRLGLMGRINNLPVQELSVDNLTRFRTLMLSAAKTKVILLDRLLSQLDQISLSFMLEWFESFSGAIIVFGEHADFLKAVKSAQLDQQILSRPLFDLVISFAQDGEAGFLTNEQNS